MAGYELSAESIIIGIRNNLEFWYKSDYAVIKELIQNADDARATRLELGWSRGLKGADHPLLRGPAVFVLNDGPYPLFAAEYHPDNGSRHTGKITDANSVSSRQQ